MPMLKTRRPGAAIVPLIVTLLLLAGVGVAMHDLLTTNVMEHAGAVPARAATYAAEAGIRLASAEYNGLASDESKTALFANINNKSFVLDANTNARFSLNFFSYGFKVVTHNEATHTIVAQAVQRVPLSDMTNAASGTISFPSGSKISVQDEIGNDVPATLARTGTVTTQADGSQLVTFVYNPPATGLPLDASADLDFVNIAYDTSSASGSADALYGLPAGMANFPPENGRVAIMGEDKTYTYRLRVVEDNGSVTLRGLEPENGSFALSDFQNRTVILRKTYAFQSTGSVGTGTYAASKTLVAFDAPKSDASGIDPTERVTDPSKVIETTMNDLSAFDSADLYVNEHSPGRTTRVVDINAYQSSQGTHVNYAAIHSLVLDNGNKDWGHVLRLNKESLFKWRWKQDTRLSYDVQTKIATGWKLPFAACGLSLRLQETGTEDEYNFYGFSFMKYYGSGDRPRGIHGDYMPDGFKPPGQGTEVRTWNTAPENDNYRPLNISETDKVLLVFWRRKNGVSTWLAYKQLAYSPWYTSSVTGDRGAYPKQWDGDGRIISDNTTLLVRAEEQFINGVKVNRFKVFYGDGSDKIGSLISRSPDSIAYNIVAGNNQRGRARYLPEWDTSRTHAYPVFPALSIGDWAVGTDFFSFIEDGPGYAVDGTLRQCKWDGVNTSAIAADPAADIRILSDGGTIRTKEFLTPNSAEWPANISGWPTNRPEAGLHAYGRLISRDRFDNAVTFDDLVLGFLVYSDTPTPLVD